jgi:hypothetical protein
MDSDTRLDRIDELRKQIGLRANSYIWAEPLNGRNWTESVASKIEFLVADEPIVYIGTDLDDRDAGNIYVFTATYLVRITIAPPPGDQWAAQPESKVTLAALTNVFDLTINEVAFADDSPEPRRLAITITLGEQEIRLPAKGVAHREEAVTLNALVPILRKHITRHSASR